MKISMIQLTDIINIEEPHRYKLHLACTNADGYSPLDAYVNDRLRWVGWNEWRYKKDDWSREFIFSLIEFYPRANTWLFGGVFRVIERHMDRYELEYVQEYQQYEGRLLINFERTTSEKRGRAFYLEGRIEQFTVAEIFSSVYTGEAFPGHYQINHDFHELEGVFRRSKADWKAALSNMKGVYLITDKKNGKHYIGAAYGGDGIWSRWSSYLTTGHGGNDQLIGLINEHTITYARANFKFALLEIMLSSSTDTEVRARESHWKRVLLPREFGYNSN